jgi:hypothetical protein
LISSSCVAPKAFYFVQSFGKLTSSKSFLLLDNRFLGAAPRAFENQPAQFRQIKKSSKYDSDVEFSFEKPAAQPQPNHFGNSTRANLADFPKLWAN